MQEFLVFRSECNQAVVTCSCRGQSAFDFIIVVDMPETSFEQLAHCPPEFDSLDMKLLAALQKRAKTIIKSELNQYYEMAKQECKRKPGQGFAAMLRGRQALWLVYEHFRTSTLDGTMFQFRHLQLVRWKGDRLHELEDFDAEFTSVLGGMERRPREEDIQDHYVREFRNTKELKEDLTSIGSRILMIPASLEVFTKEPPEALLQTSCGSQ